MEVIDRVRQSLAPRYELEDEVGRGGFAIVFRALDTRHRRTVAVKVLNPDLWAGTVAGERFQREISIVSTLQHPNILPLFDSGDIEGLPYFVMPFVSGDSLADRLERVGPLSIQETLSIARDVAAGLGHAHRQGIVHRDIKPANILLSEGRAVIADFGIARAAESNADTFRTATGHAPGTPAYMSPEHLGSQEIDSRSDLYSLGCVLFEALSGEPPFTGRTIQAVIARHMYEQPPSLEVVRPTVPSGIAEAIERTLHKVPADRIQTAQELVEALEKGMDTPIRRLDSRRRAKHRWQLTFGLVGALALGGLVIRSILGPGLSLDDHRVVVFPFVRVGETDPDGLGWDVALAIEAALEHTNPLRPIDGREWLPPEIQRDPSLLTPQASKAIAESRGAGRYISGLLQAGEDSIGVTVRLHDVTGDDVLGRETAWGKNGLSFHEVGLDAVQLLLPHLLDPGQTVDLAPFTDRETGAIALTIQGDRAYRESRYADAVDLYRRALDEDSLLAIAAARAATAAAWEEEHREALTFAEHAVRHGEDLPDRYAEFVQGVKAYLSGDGEKAILALEAALALEPNWPEAETILGEVYYHLLPADLDLSSRAQSVFESLAGRHPGFAPPLLHLTEVEIRAGRLERARELIDHLAEISDPDAPVVDRLSRMTECVESEGGNPDLWTEMAAEDPKSVMTAGLALAAAGAQPICAEQAFSAVRMFGGEWEWGSLLALQSLWLAEGRIQETLEMLDEALSNGFGAVFTLFVFDAGISDAFNERAREAEEVARNAFGDLYNGASGLNLWLLGVWFATLGEAERSEALAREIEAHYLEGPHEREARVLAAALDAHTALANGDEEEAIRRFSELRPTADLWQYYWEFHEALGPERIRWARALLGKGDYQGAIRVASLFDHPVPITYLAYLAPSLAIRLKAAEALGRADLVVQFRRRLTLLGWENAEVPLSMEGPLMRTHPRKETP